MDSKGLGQKGEDVGGGTVATDDRPSHSPETMNSRKKRFFSLEMA